MVGKRAVPLPFVLKPVPARTQSGGAWIDLVSENVFCGRGNFIETKKGGAYAIKDLHRDSDSVDLRVSGRL
jgi:hypothetical protein